MHDDTTNHQSPPANAEEMDQFLANLKDLSYSKIKRKLERSWVGENGPSGCMSHRVGEKGDNIFHACVRMSGTEKVIKCLGEMIANSAAINEENADGMSPLHLAVSECNSAGADDAKIAALVDAGADKEALHAAVSQRASDLKERASDLMEVIDYDEVIVDCVIQRVTPLQMAVFTGKHEVVKVRSFELYQVTNTCQFGLVTFNNAHKNIFFVHFCLCLIGLTFGLTYGSSYSKWYCKWPWPVCTATGCVRTYTYVCRVHGK